MDFTEAKRLVRAYRTAIEDAEDWKHLTQRDRDLDRLRRLDEYPDYVEMSDAIYLAEAALLSALGAGSVGGPRVGDWGDPDDVHIAPILDNDYCNSDSCCFRNHWGRWPRMTVDEECFSCAGIDPDGTQCIQGGLYVACGHEFCEGGCEYGGRCQCPCHKVRES